VARPQIASLLALDSNAPNKKVPVATDLPAENLVTGTVRNLQYAQLSVNPTPPHYGISTWLVGNLVFHLSKLTTEYTGRWKLAVDFLSHVGDALYKYFRVIIY
jgi:hypothetical protein